MAATKCACGRWTEALEALCLYCQTNSGWEHYYPLPVDVYIAKEMGWLDEDDPNVP